MRLNNVKRYLVYEQVLTYMLNAVCIRPHKCQNVWFRFYKTPVYLTLILREHCDGMKRYFQFIVLTLPVVALSRQQHFAYLESPRLSHFPSLREEGPTLARDFSNLAGYSRTMKTVFVKNYVLCQAYQQTNLTLEINYSWNSRAAAERTRKQTTQLIMTS